MSNFIFSMSYVPTLAKNLFSQRIWSSPFTKRYIVPGAYARFYPTSSMRRLMQPPGAPGRRPFRRGRMFLRNPPRAYRPAMRDLWLSRTHKRRLGYGRKFISKSLTRRQRKQVSKLIRDRHSQDSVNYRRYNDGDQKSSVINQVSYFTYGLGSRTSITNTIDGSYCLGPASGVVTGQTIDMTTGAQERVVDMLNMYQKLMIRNNWDHPAYLESFHFVCRKNTNTNPYDLLEAAWADKGLTPASAAVDFNFNVWDGLRTVGDYWRMVKHKKVCLNPGESCTYEMVRRRSWRHDVDPDETFEWVAHVGQMIIFRLHGGVAHDDANTTQVGLAAAKVDVVYQGHYKWSSRVDAGFKRFADHSSSLGTISTAEMDTVSFTNDVVV